MRTSTLYDGYTTTTSTVQLVTMYVCGKIMCLYFWFMLLLLLLMYMSVADATFPNIYDMNVVCPSVCLSVGFEHKM